MNNPRGRHSVYAEARSSAPACTVFALLKDGSTWPRWTIFDAFELERPGRDEPMGVGAIRVFMTKISKAREEIVELIPDRRLSYVLLSGFPLKNYRADVDLTPISAGGTAIHWQAAFDPKYPGSGWFWRIFLRRVFKQAAQDLAAGAENPQIAALLKV